MSFRFGVLVVVAAYVASTSALPPCVCTRELKPVCGTDGQTYNNMCLLECKQQSDQNLQLKSSGHCRSARQIKDCVCTLDYTPVCGSDSRTYPNKCALQCEGGSVTVAYKGECRIKRQVPCVCPYNLDPVCGTNGRTYPNKCTLNCERGSVGLAHNGNCRRKRQVPCACTFIYAPVCGTNGRTYPNKCALECEPGNIGVAYTGECRMKRDAVQVSKLPPCLCTREGRPVCGTDGKTYSNPCLLNCVREQKEELHILHSGPCKGDVINVGKPKSQQSCACARNLQPVCASDGTTYNNECLMQCAGGHLTVVHDGPCEYK